MISPTMKGFIPQLDLALMFAVEAHAGVLDKQGKPYILHPLRMLLMAQELGLDETTQIAILLHDTVEDTEVTLAQIRFYFGDEVADIVDCLTRREVDGVKEEYFVFIKRLAKNIRALKAKLLDIFDNMRPERFVPNLTGLNGRYRKAQQFLMRELENSSDIQDAYFLDEYRFAVLNNLLKQDPA